MTEPLGDRQGQILVAIVREFIRSADPVGSKHLVGTFHLNVSPATVRNDMARLEELGFLAQPHSSAGRVPTDRGYRYFVDGEAPARLSESARREIEQVAASVHGDFDELIRRANEILSRTTGLAAAALTPPLRAGTLKHLDVAWIGPRHAMVVVVASGGRVDKRTVDLDCEIDEATLDQIGSDLNHRLAGSAIADAAVLAHEAATNPSGVTPPGGAKQRAGNPNAPDTTVVAAVARAVAAALDALLAADQEVVVGGAANLAANADMSRIEQFARVFDVIERRAPLQQAMSQAQMPATVKIGSELPVEDLHACSIVVAPFADNATIGIIGPTRIEYPRMIAAVSAMAKMLDEALGELS